MLVDRFENKLAPEKLVLAFAFGEELDAGESLTAVQSAVVTVLSGTDATPSDLLNGSAAIVGTDVLVPVKAGVGGVDYRLRIVVATSNASKVLARDGRLYVEP